MLGSGDNTGIISLLIGLVLVVLCGIGISLIADTRLRLGDSTASIQTSIESDKEKLEKLRSNIEFQEQAWIRDHAPLIDLDQQVDTLRTESEANTRRLAALRTQRADLQNSLLRIAEDHQAYQSQYRTQARADSVGQKIDSLTLTNGRNYLGVVIRGFDSSGLRIHHQGGSARIAYSELPKPMQDQLQWNRSEFVDPQPKVATDQDVDPPQDIAELTPAESPPENRPDQAQQNVREADEAKLLAARENFRNTLKAYLETRSQAFNARSRSNTSQKSVPGALETWAERAQRLETLSQRLNSAHLTARRELSSISPGDALLRTPTR